MDYERHCLCTENLLSSQMQQTNKKKVNLKFTVIDGFLH